MDTQAVGKIFVDPDQINVEVDADVSNPVTVAVNTFRGRANLNIRHWCQQKDGKFARTPKGVVIPFDDRVELLNALVNAVNLAATDGSQVRLVLVTDGVVEDLM